MADYPSIPPFASWPSFPFEGELSPKPLDEPVAVEPARHGENPAECRACNAPDDAYIWVSERWRVRSLDRPTGLPVVLILEPRSHLDLGDLPNLLAAELGVLTVRIERAIRSLDGVARVHVNRWGDGAFHMHVWFMARPQGMLQLRGTFLSMWNDILPAIPEDRWHENLALVAAWLAEFDGKALAEPPRINWTAPSRIESDSATLLTDSNSERFPDPAAGEPNTDPNAAGDPTAAPGSNTVGAAAIADGTEDSATREAAPSAADARSAPDRTASLESTSVPGTGEGPDARPGISGRRPGRRR